jgi:cytochrome c oxidase subunit 2
MLVPTVTADARAIDSLFYIALFFATIVFIIVEGLILITVVKYKRKSPDEMPYQNHGNIKLELFWTIVPALLVILLFVFSLNTLSQLSGTGTSTNPVNNVHRADDEIAKRRIEEAKRTDLVVEVTGRQWFWQYRHVKDGVRSDSQNNQPLVIPEGQVVRLDMKSADVLHAWWIPSFGGMLYLNPGEISYIWIDKAPVGNYVGQCNVYCGNQHAQMLLNVKVLPKAEYDSWVKQKKAEQGGVAHIEGGDVARGAKIYVNGGYKYAESLSAGNTQIVGLDAGEVADLVAYIDTLK